jgi:hypothetical protein
MNPQFSLTSAAERDLAEQVAYLGKDNPDLGERFLLGCDADVRGSHSFPGDG